MYRRYSQVGEGNPSFSQVRRGRMKNILILLLVLALAATVIYTLPIIRERENIRSLYVQQIQRECKDAYADTATLSRTAGADSAAILARVRSNIHAIRVINSISAADGGRQLLESERLLTMQNMVDRYLEFLTTGMDTGEYTTSLQTSLLELQDIVAGLE